MRNTRNIIKTIARNSLAISGLITCLMIATHLFAIPNDTSDKSNIASSHLSDKGNTSSSHASIIIPILQTTEHPALNVARKGIEDELSQAGYRSEYESAQGNTTLASQIAQKFVGESPKVMIGIGTTATQSLISNNRKHGISIVFSSVTDPIGARIVTDLKKPGDNVTGVSDYTDPAQQFALFKKIFPKLSRLGVIYNPGESNSKTLVDAMAKEVEEFGMELVTASANTSAEVADATFSLVDKVDAIFIDNDNTALSAFDSITKIATQHKIPVFVSDTDMLNRGALAALGPDQYNIGRQVGRLAIRILQGEPAANLSVLFPEKVELHLNLKAAKAVHVTIPPEIIKEAAKVIE